ncbi:hemerythrin domain-containing protein [Streptomyces sp. NPDC057217]|uniref:hemerythrin domain-containing protein n=1 Tax=Streptomyces sp. NPDC057217 TaxID=3346054 RepID=UPI003634E307
MSVSLAHQSLEELGGNSSVLALQRRDHAELDRLMRHCESAGLSVAERRATFQEIVRLTFSHAFAEETVLWPALRRLVPDGEELTARVEEEHQQINDLVAEILSAEPNGPWPERLVSDAFALIRQDIRDEEDVLLPRLQEALGHDATRLRRLGSAWESVRRTAPTRPHPAVSRRPPGNALAGVPLSAVDRARDALSPLTGPRGRSFTTTLTAAIFAACVVAALRHWRR